MVSNKTIIILITIAIILSVFSIVVTISTADTKMVPDVSKANSNVISDHDNEGAKVSLIVNKPTP